jgi:hypothetical protein
MQKMFRRRSRQGYGDMLEKLVGARGFEPPTTSTPRRCATRLRYAPKQRLVPASGHNVGAIIPETIEGRNEMPSAGTRAQECQHVLEFLNQLTDDR